MVELIKPTRTSKIFSKEPMDKKLLLSSLKDFSKDGVALGVEKILPPIKNNYGKVSVNTILTILGNMPKARQYVLDEDGQFVMYTDEKTGETKRDIELCDASLSQVFFTFYATIVEGETGLDEDTKLLVTPGTSSYSFFREGYIAAGEIDEVAEIGAFTTTYKEMKECLLGFEFIGKYARSNNNRFDYLECVRVDDDEIYDELEVKEEDGKE